MGSQQEDALVGDATMPIAIVGIGFRGPGDATNVENLWKMVSEGRESWSKIPKERWNHEAFYHPDPNRNGTYNLTGGHFLEQDITKWDAPFFQMSAAEAAALDPQQRLMLECTYEAMESSGTTMEQLCGSNTSVFAGSFTTDYTDLLWRDPDAVPMYQCTNASHSRSNLANRLSYFFDLRGQSVAIDTACSTGLVGLHLGCQSLRTGESKFSIVAGANVVLTHDIMVTMSMMRFLSPDGRCYTFDERANGYARGEGIGALLLKPLADALRDGDTVRAVIRGTGSSQDGKTPGITMPNGSAQEDLIRAVYQRAGLNPLQTDYVECHGTGTQAGDPLETKAISKIFCQDRDTSNPIRIGSVKTNVGHLEAASGIGGVIKSILMLENKVYLPNRNFEKANPRIPLEQWKLKIPLSVEPWNASYPRRISVNSFGYGGAIAHIILESAEDYLAERRYSGSSRAGRSLISADSLGSITGQHTAHNNNLTNGVVNGLTNGHTNGLTNGHSDSKSSTNGHSNGFKEASFTSETRARLIVLSSFDESTGGRQVENLRQYLEDRLDICDQSFVDNLAFTLNERRTHHIWKAALIARSAQDLADTLKKGVPFVTSGTKGRRLGFVFTGQGAQWCGMGKELISAYPIFRSSLEASSRCLKNAGAPFDVINELTRDPMTSDINRALYSQPLCSAVQIALVDLLASFGIKPSSVTGHSSGEIAAAYAIGALNLEDAMRVAYFRGVASTSLASKGIGKGSMMAVGLSKEDALPYLASLTKGKAVVACSNSPSSITISGDESAIDELLGTLEEQKIFARKLIVEVAYHSHHMTHVGEEYRDAISDIRIQPNVDGDFYSSVTGMRAVATDLGPDYWVDNMLGEVKFSDSVKQLCLGTYAGSKAQRRNARTGVNDILEIGPHSALAGPIKQIIQADDKLASAGIAYYSALTRNKDAVETVLRFVSSLFTLGYSIDFPNINRPSQAKRASVLVDLPPYSWNHTNTYWAEPRKSKAYRNRAAGRTDLLGALEMASSPLEPRWSNYIRLSEIPWVRDHVIQSNIVYPAAGYIVMAIEAAHQRAEQRSISNISGYSIREVVIGAALVIPENPGEVEVAITLKPYSESMRSPSDLWDEFVVSSVTPDNRWTEHCRGIISVQALSTTENVVNGASQQAADRNEILQLIENYNKNCRKEVQFPQFYETISKMGLEYGPSFACMTEARFGQSSCVGRIKIPDTAAVMPKEYQSPFVIHPATLDALFHTIFVALGVDDMKDPAVPVSLEEMFVASNITRQCGHELVSYTSTKKKDNRSISASLTVMSQDQQELHKPVISIQGLSCITLENSDSQDAQTEKQFRGYNVAWKPDLDMISSMALVSSLPKLPLLSRIERSHKFEIAAFHLLKSVVETCDREGVTIPTQYQQDLWRLVSGSVATMTDQNTSTFSNKWLSIGELEQAAFLEEVKSHGPEGQALCYIGERLIMILKGELLQPSLASGLDLSPFFGPSDLFIDSVLVAKCVEMITFKHPGLSILACGELSGFLSIPVLEALHTGNAGSAPFTRFDYTDLSFDLKDLVKLKCPAWTDLILQKKLDIEGDLTTQDNVIGSYDVVIVFQTLAPTALASSSLENAHKLLRPGGKLILIGEPENSLVATMFSFLSSNLPRIEEGTEVNLIAKDNWPKKISETGFSQDLTFPDALDNRKQTVRVMTALSTETATSAFPNVLIVGSGEDLNISVQLLTKQLSAFSISVESSSFEDAKPRTDQVCIVLSEPKRGLLTETTERDWDMLKNVLLRSGGVLWITRGATASSTDPTSNLVSGLVRTIRSENGGIPLLNLDLDPNVVLEDSKAVDLIKILFDRYFKAGIEPKDIEPEYAERDGVLMIPRLVEDNELIKFVRASTDQLKPEPQLFRQLGRPLRIHVETPGLLDSMYFVDDERFVDELPSNWVQMEIEASGINFKDVMMALGQIPVKNLGLEASGFVTAIGEDVTHLKVGDRVVSYGLGLLSSDYRGPQQTFHKLPDNLPFITAATIPITYSTAYYSIHHIARLQKGETVLVHAASGGLGQAIIELCQLVGAEIYATVGTAAKKQFLMDHFKIPEDHIFFSRNSSFAKGIKRMTQDRGVDVIFNSLAGENLRLTWDCIAPWGRFVELGQRDIMINTRLEMQPLSRNATFSAFLLDDLVEQRPEIATKVLQDVLELFRIGAIRGPAQVHTYPIGDIESALRTMQTGGHMGKLVATNVAGDMVKALHQDKSKHLLSSDASYMLVGGLGGIGRATALWMTEHGAKNLILVNRSGLKSEEAKVTVESLKEKGANVVVYSCDITDAVKVKATVTQATKEMPPIKGVIQGAMLLRDTLFEQMTLDDYKSVLRPKVQGTWNLHDFLPKDMDFFIMESSVSGIIGNATQASYAAGNTFLDAFASYRNSQGLPASTIDLGAISDVGYLATNTELRDAMERQGFELTDKKTLMSLIHFAIQNPRREGLLSQSITGLGTWTEGGSLDSLSLPLFSHFRSLTSGSSSEAEGTTNSAGDLKKSLSKAKTIEEASEIVSTALVEKIAARAGLGIEHVDVANPISDYGIDSLVAVEIRNWISKDMGSTVPILELLANGPLSGLALKIAQRSRLVQVGEKEKS